MKVEINNLMSIKNYAEREGVTASYIYKLEKQGRMELFQTSFLKMFIYINEYTLEGFNEAILVQKYMLLIILKRRDSNFSFEAIVTLEDKSLINLY